MSAPLAGGPARVLVAGASPHVLALTDDAIYYSRFSRDIWRFPLPNGPAERVAEMQSGAFSLGVDGQALYWRASASVIDGVTANRAIVRMPLAGGPPAVVRMNEPYVLGRMVFRGGFAYMSIDEAVDGLRRVPLDGGPPTMLLEQAVGPPIVDETSVYYFEGGNVIADGMLKKVPLDGFGPPVVLAWNLHRPSSIAVDATSAYVTTEHGAVLKLTPK